MKMIKRQIKEIHNHTKFTIPMSKFILPISNICLWRGSNVFKIKISGIDEADL